MANLNDEGEDESAQPPAVSLDQTSLTPDQIAALKVMPTQGTPPQKTLDQLEADNSNAIGQAAGAVFKGSPFKSYAPPMIPAQQPQPQNVDLGLQPKQQMEAQVQDPYMKSLDDSAQSQVNMMRQQGAAATESARLLAQQAAEQQKQYEEAAQKAQDLTSDYKKQYDAHTTELHNVLKDLNNGHINPNQFYESKSVPQKIATAIGMMLSSVGSGMLHQENPVMRWLNSQVDRDIEAQKSNINSAYSHYRNQIGDDRQAENMARAVLQQNYADKIRATASKYAGPREQQSAAAVAAQFEGNAQNLLGQIAMKKAQMNQISGMQQGASNGSVPPSQQFRAMVNAGMIPKEQEKAIATEIGNAENTQKSYGMMLSAFDRAAKENTVARTGAGMLRTPASISEMDALALPLIHDAEGRVNEFEQKTLQALHPLPGDSDSKVAEKRQGFINFMSQKAATPMANMYGINIPKPKQFTPYGK